MIRPLAVVLSLGLFPSIAQHSSVPLTPAGNGHLESPAYINGKGPFPFVMDTGADATGVYAWFARAQKLKAGTSDEVVGQTGATSMPTYRLDSVAVAGQTLRHVIADSYSDRRDQEVVAGVVGNDFMDSVIAVFDTPCRRLTLFPKTTNMRQILTPAAHLLVGGKVREGTQLTFPVQIGNTAGIAVLDTGARDTRINRRFASAAGIDPASAAFHDADVVYGTASKGIASRKGPVGTVRFAGIEIRDAQARVIDLPVFDTFGIGDKSAMIFGLDFMRNLRLVYDHKNSRFWFDRSTCSAN